MEARRLAILYLHIRPVVGLNLRPSLSQISNLSCSSKVNEEQHLDAFEEGKQQNDCIFCKIVRRESPSCKVYEDDVCLRILDIHPLSHGHSLIIPKLHFSSLEATPPSVVAAKCSKVPSISKAVMAITNADYSQHRLRQRKLNYHSAFPSSLKDLKDINWESFRTGLPNAVSTSKVEPDPLMSFLHPAPALGRKEDSLPDSANIKSEEAGSNEL